MRVFLIFLLCLPVALRAQGTVPLPAQHFPSLLWVHIQPEQTTFIEQLCLRNIHNYAKQSQFQVRVVTNSNYTNYLPPNDTLPQSISPNILVPREQVLSTLIKLTLLHKHGGVWLQLPLLLVEGLAWVKDIRSQRFINNRMADPSVVMFYQPSPLWGWLDSSSPVSHPTVESVLIAPRYQSWFIAAQPESAFIEDWKALFLEMSTKDYAGARAYLKPLSTWYPWNYLDSEEIQSWTARMTVQLKQLKLDQSAAGKLAVKEYKLTTIDASKSALAINYQANNFVHLTAKYYSQVPLNRLDVKPNHLIRFDPGVESQLEGIIDNQVPELEHLHSSVSMICQGEEYPYRYVVKGSLVDQYLLAPYNQSAVSVYDPVWIKRKCYATYFGVYWEFIVTYVLPLFLIVAHIYIVRKAILVFRPQWGYSKRQRMQLRKQKQERQKRQARLDSQQ